MPSPTAASLGKYGDIPVSLYTGTPNISIPIYEVKGRALSLPISLSYHASGVKVEEIAGWVGLGWSLNAGGVITRTVRGLPDELNNGNSQGYYYTGSNLNNNNTWQGGNQAYLDSVKQEYKDSEPDLFFFNFAGRSGQFVLGPDDVIRPIPYEKISITKAISGSDITQWIITAEDGVRYIFAQLEQTYDQSVVQNVPHSSNPNRTFVSSWYLTKIESPHGNDNIRLGYKTLASPAGYPIRTYKEKKAVIQQSVLFGVIIAELDSFEVQNTSNIQNPVYLEKIISGVDSVRFYTSSRTDFANEHRLDSLKLYTNNQLKRTYVLRYGDFSNGTTKRHRLEKLVEKTANNDSLPPYKFEYNTSQYLPDYDSNGMDYWGFYNGKNGNGTLIPPYENASLELFLPGADRRPDTTYLKAGILEKITYPTGGYTQFTYEPHDFSKIADQSVTTDYPTNYSAYVSSSFGITSKDTFTVAATPNELVCVEVRLNGTGASLPPDGGMFATVTLKTIGETVINSWQSDTVQNYCETYWLSPGDYVLVAESEYDEPNNYNTTAYARVDWQTASSANQRFGGGLRIKRIRHHDGISSANDVILDYEYKITSGGATLSSGVLVNETKFYGTISNPNPADNAWVYRSSTSRTPLGITHGAHVGYRQVTVLHGSNGKYGKVVHQFRAPDTILDDMSFDSNQGNAYDLGGFTSYDWKRGQVINTARNDSTGAKRQRADFFYTFKDDSATVTTRRYRALSMKWIGEDIGVPPTNLYHIKPYEVISPWVYQNKETITYYGPSSTDSVVTTKDFYYNEPNHVQLSRLVETNSDGAKRLTSLKYPLDYTTSPTTDQYVQAMDSLKTKHIHNAVIQKVIRQQKSGQTDSSVYSAELVKYKKFATGQFLPFETYQFDSTAFLNLTDSQLFNTTGGTFNKHAQYKRQLTNEQYDVYGNPTQVKYANNASLTAIFGYNSSLPVARIGNATASQATVSIFDDNSDAGWMGNGTWVLSNGVYQQTSLAGDGTAPWDNPRYYNNVSLDDCIFEADIRLDGATMPQYTGLSKYIDGTHFIRFVFRYESPNPVVRILARNGALSPFVDAAKTFNPNQWYHLRCEINGSNAKLYVDGELLINWSDSAVDQGTGKIGLCTLATQASFDNVRYYPPTALAFSGSYDSKYLTFNTLTDENGLSQRFIYDNFGRLKSAQDALGNLVQSLSYYFSSPFSASNPNYIKTTLASNTVHHVRNCDFENGAGAQPDYWIGETFGSGCTAAWDNTVSFSGAKSIKAIIPTAGSSNRVRWMVNPWYDEKVSPKETYRMEVWAKTSGGYNGNAKFQLFFHNLDHTVVTESPTITIPAGDREWTKYTLDFTPLSTTDHLYTIYLDFNSSGTYKGTVWYDRANFYELNTAKTFTDGLWTGNSNAA